MKSSCLEITQISAFAKQAIFLPQHTKGLTGLLFFRYGNGDLTGPSEPPLHIKAGTAAIYPAHRPYRLEIREDASLLLLAFSGVQSNVSQARLAKYSCPQLNKLAQSMEQIRSAVQADELLAHLSVQPAPEPERIPPYVKTARMIIDECYKADLTLEELSSRVGRSKFHLSRVFRDCYHIAPGAYLASVRLTRAAELLASTNLPVLEVGRQAGFPNSAYFTTLFKKHFGCSPGEYRTLRRNHG